MVRLTDHLDMIIAVDRGRQATTTTYFLYFASEQSLSFLREGLDEAEI